MTGEIDFLRKKKQMELSDQELKEVEYKLEECSNNLESLNEWEQSFVTDVSDQLSNYSRISQKQLEVLEKIYGKLK